MKGKESTEHERQSHLEEDTDAIMSRRRFFIASTLAGAGLGAVLSGCGGRRSTFPEPQPCLSIAPKPQPNPPEPYGCLSVDPDDWEPDPDPDSIPRVCLTVQ